MRSFALSIFVVLCCCVLWFFLWVGIDTTYTYLSISILPIFLSLHIFPLLPYLILNVLSSLFLINEKCFSLSKSTKFKLIFIIIKIQFIIFIFTFNLLTGNVIYSVPCLIKVIIFPGSSNLWHIRSMTLMRKVRHKKNVCGVYKLTIV